MRGQQEFRPIEAFYATETSSMQNAPPMQRAGGAGRACAPPYDASRIPMSAWWPDPLTSTVSRLLTTMSENFEYTK